MHVQKHDIRIGYGRKIRVGEMVDYPQLELRLDEERLQLLFRVWKPRIFSCRFFLHDEVSVRWQMGSGRDMSHDGRHDIERYIGKDLELMIRKSIREEISAVYPDITNRLQIALQLITKSDVIFNGYDLAA